MKKLTLFYFAIMLIVSCAETNSDGSVKLDVGDNNPKTVVIDNCEYISWGYGMAHKGNCKFCAERHKKEYTQVVDSLFMMQD